MMLAPATAESKPAPLAPALVAMTALQALVCGAMFAPGILAPRIGIDATMLGLYTTTLCAVGMVTAMIGGVLASRFGGFRMASVCAVLVFIAMGLTVFAGASPLILVVGVVIGCAFGPETPASSTVLARVAPPALRPLAFSLRQTGNQIGAMLGSLLLPWLAADSPAHGFVAIMACALVALIAFEWLRPSYDPLVLGAAKPVRLRDTLAILAADRDLRRIAIAAVPFSAMQVSLNAFLVTYAVTSLGLDLIAAGIVLATAQGGGFVGRVAFGVMALRLPAWTTVTVLGFGMSAAAAAVAIADPIWPWPALLLLAFGFGLTASGWNGLALAEIARLAPEGRVGEATGAALVASYCGLTLGPLLVAAIGNIGLAYLVLAAASLGGALLLLGRHR